MSSGAGQRLYFGNLDPQVTQQELEREVNRFGETKSVWVAKNPSGFAFVEYVELRDAEECLKQLNSVRLGDKIVRIEFAKNRGTQKVTPGLSPVLAKAAAASAEPPPAQPVEASLAEGPPKVKHRAVLKNLPASFSWRELKDEMRRIGDIIYADLDDNGDGVVEFATLEDLEYAVRRLDGSRLDGQVISVFKEIGGNNGAAAPMSAAAPPPPAPPAAPMPPQHVPSREYGGPAPPPPRHNGGYDREYDGYDERGREQRRDDEFERGGHGGGRGHDARGYGGGADRYDDRGGGRGYVHDERRYDEREREREFDRGPRSHRSDRDDYHDDRRDRRRW